MSATKQAAQGHWRRAVRGVVRVVRTLFAFVPPWDFDELPVRHWWDVYAK